MVHPSRARALNKRAIRVLNTLDYWRTRLRTEVEKQGLKIYDINPEPSKVSFDLYDVQVLYERLGECMKELRDFTSPVFK